MYSLPHQGLTRRCNLPIHPEERAAPRGTVPGDRNANAPERSRQKTRGTRSIGIGCTYKTAENGRDRVERMMPNSSYRLCCIRAQVFQGGRWTGPEQGSNDTLERAGLNCKMTIFGTNQGQVGTLYEGY